MVIDHREREVRLHLSVSKNDPQAKGTWRPWRCVCDEVADDAHRHCPFHAAVFHRQKLEEEFGDKVSCDDFPLFPDRLGYEIRPECVVLFLEAIALLIGEALFTAKGVRRFGKHTLRASGAVHLALMGIAVD